MKPWLIPCLLVVALAALVGAPAPTGNARTHTTFGDRHVLLIGIDGLRSDALKQAIAQGTAPHLKSLVEGGSVSWNAYAGGELGTDTQQPTISGPGWASIFTGVWMNRHHVDGNATPPVNQPDVKGSYMVDQAPHFARRLKSYAPAANVASFAAWGWIETYLVAAQPDALDTHDRGVGIKYPDRDLNTKTKTLGYLETNTPDVLIVHFDQVDGAGHSTGFGIDNPIYMDAIHKVDEHIGEVLEAVRRRAPDGKWLVLVTTDHGGIARKHGGQSPEERTIPIIANGPGIPAGQVIDTPVGHTIIPPTIFRYLNVPVDASWGWNAAAFAFDAAVVTR